MRGVAAWPLRADPKLVCAGCVGYRKRFPPLIETVAQFLAGLEERHALFCHLNAVASAWIAPDAGITVPDRECSEAAQLDAIAAGQGCGDLAKHRRHYRLDVALVKVGIPFRESLNELGLGHDGYRSRYSDLTVTVPNLPPSVNHPDPTGGVPRSIAWHWSTFFNFTARPSPCGALWELGRLLFDLAGLEVIRL
jgi:hypothetical protein